MKKWFPAFLFLSLSGCNDALAIQSTMFYSFNDNIYRPRLSVKVTDVIQIIVDINSASSTATLSYVDCNGFTWSHG
ncbi:TPA: fimbrial protein, partial [Escherichia coli]|nr:fimbrial protein [Escherichia coli]